MNKFLFFPQIYMDNDEGSGSGSGDPAPNTIDWSKVTADQVPENLVKETSLYKGILTESVERRQTIKSLRDQISKLDDGEVKPITQPATTPTDAPNAALAQVLEQLNTLTTRMDTQDATNLTAWQDQAAKATGLTGRVVKTLSGKNYNEVLADAKALATELNIKPPMEGTLEVGNPNTERDRTALEQAKNRMQNKAPINPFSPEVQRSIAGGVVNGE